MISWPCSPPCSPWRPSAKSSSAETRICSRPSKDISPCNRTRRRSEVEIVTQASALRDVSSFCCVTSWNWHSTGLFFLLRIVGLRGRKEWWSTNCIRLFEAFYLYLIESLISVFIFVRAKLILHFSSLWSCGGVEWRLILSSTPLLSSLYAAFCARSPFLSSRGIHTNLLKKNYYQKYFCSPVK